MKLKLFAFSQLQDILTETMMLEQKCLSQCFRHWPTIVGDMLCTMKSFPCHFFLQSRIYSSWTNHVWISFTSDQCIISEFNAEVENCFVIWPGGDLNEFTWVFIVTEGNFILSAVIYYCQNQTARAYIASPKTFLILMIVETRPCKTWSGTTWLKETTKRGHRCQETVPNNSQFI